MSEATGDLWRLCQVSSFTARDCVFLMFYIRREQGFDHTMANGWCMKDFLRDDLLVLVHTPKSLLGTYHERCTVIPSYDTAYGSRRGDQGSSISHISWSYV